MISTTAIAEDIVTDTGKAVGGVAGGALVRVRVLLKIPWKMLKKALLKAQE